jgi:hypothetical protein
MDAVYFSLCADAPVAKKAREAIKNNFFIVLIFFWFYFF